VAILRGTTAFTNAEPLDCVVARLKDLQDGSSDADLIFDARNGLSFTRLNVQDSVDTDPGFVGDCNGNKDVRVNELVTAVGIALNVNPLSACPAIDVDGDGLAKVHELIAAVRANLMGGCPFETSGNP
jgi:hypothetical protein